MKLNSKSQINLAKATSSFLENSLPIFIPVKNIHKTKAYNLFKKNKGSLIVETLFGGIEIRGTILGQNHKDILESLLCQKKLLVKSDDSIMVNFGRYKFLQDISRSTGNYNWLEDKIKEIRDFNFNLIYYDVNGKRKTLDGGYGIIDKYKFEENGTMSIKFTKEFTDFYRKENLLSYGEYVPKIAKIKEPFIKGIVREMIKHKKYNIYLSTFIKNYNIELLISDREIRNIKNELKDIETLFYLKKEFNITIEEKQRDFLISIVRDNTKVQNLENNKTAYPTKKNGTNQ